MTTNANPDIDPANNDTLVGAIRFSFAKMLQNVDNMLPARVIKYDRNANRVQVQILIAIVATDGSVVPRPQIASIPVLVLGGGGFFLNFPLNEGDLGWVSANDRDISLFLQTYNEAKPNTARIKNFADALFIPDIMRGYTISGDDTDNAVFQNLDGSVKIALSDTVIKISAPQVIIDGNTEIDGNLVVTGTITSDGLLTAESGASITGNLAVDGDITATGDITPNV